MKNVDYWKKRSELLEKGSFERGEALTLEIEILFEKANSKIDKELLLFYNQLAQGNDITLLEARKLLTSSELKEFRWDLEEYIQACKSVNGEWTQEILNASLRERITRLEATQKKIQWIVDELSQKIDNSMYPKLEASYKDSYYHTVYETQTMGEEYHRIEALNQKELLNIIKKPWTLDGKTFSDRIWTDQQKLYDSLNTDLTHSIMRGESVSEASHTLSYRMGVGYRNAKRLVRTEFAAYHSRATKDAYVKDGVERYKILATIDWRTSPICRELNGKVFGLSAYEVGVTAPPFHPNCRTTTMAMLPEKYRETFKELGYDDWLKYAQ